MNTFRKAAALLPLSLCGEALVLPEDIKASAEEMRLRCGQAMTVLSGGKEITIAPDRIITSDDLYSVMEKATCASMHAVENELSHGYLSVENGIRIGICGTGIMRKGELSGIRDFSSLAIRIPHDVSGCSREAFNKINCDSIKNVLVVSPPGYGKTTFLRDYIRCLSECGLRVAVADERGELAAVCDGTPQFDLGRSTDIMNGIKKADAAGMMLKTMNPQVIVMDEISGESDISAVASAAGCGVKIIATAHAGGISDLRCRKQYRELLSMSIFEYAVIIHNDKSGRTYTCEELASCDI